MGIVPMTPLPAGMLFDGDQNTLADVAFQDFGFLLLAVGCLANGAVVAGNFCDSTVNIQ